MVLAKTATATATRTAYVVRDRSLRVVLVFWGEEAAEEAAVWASRGYRVDEADAADFQV
jgi:hypothetical protein